MFHIDALMGVLPKALLGWMGVFIVIMVIIIVIYLFNWIFSKKD